ASLVHPTASPHVTSIREKALAARNLAVTNIEKKQKFYKERYGKHRHVEYKQGDQVKVFTPASQSVEVTAGSFWKPLPVAITYEASPPLTYKTEWYHVEALQVLPMRHLMQPKVCSRRSTKSLTLWNRNFVREGLSWCCGVATHHKLDALVMDEAKLKNQLRAMTRGLSDTLVNVSKMSQAFATYQEVVNAAFENTETKIKEVEDSTNKIRKRGYRHDLILATLLQLETESMKRMVLINRVMKQHQVPSEVIPVETLTRDLMKLEEEIRSTSEGLAIPVSDACRYYQLPICDFFF
ncbi:hypothetical protein TcasGA2_TC016131, partial [Tribolium castaneum]